MKDKHRMLAVRRGEKRMKVPVNRRKKEGRLTRVLEIMERSEGHK